MQGTLTLTESDKWWIAAFAACLALMFAGRCTDNYNVKVGDGNVLLIM